MKIPLTTFGRGAGHSISSSHSSSTRSNSSRSSTSAKSNTSRTKSVSSKKSTPKSSSSKIKSTAKPGSTIKTSDGKTVKSSTIRPSNAKYTRASGIVGDHGYSPRFTNGYSAPAGSVIYYQDHSALDYLPWVYLFSQNSSPAPSQQTVTVVQPDGKQVQEKPAAGGVDGLAILNWVILIILIIGVIGGLVWFVNKKTSKKT